MLQHEVKAWDSGYRFVAGVDEAGRGPLAGPVVAAAVWIQQDFLQKEADDFFKGLTDSKKLSHERREFFFQKLWGHSSIKIGLGEANVLEIDRLNILKATHLAMQRALAPLREDIDHVLVDASFIKRHDLKNSQQIQGTAILSYNKKKNQWGWKLISIQ